MKNFTSILFLLFTFVSLNTVLSQSTATYDFTFTSIWNATDHTSIPSGPHWSPLVGATHKNANEFLSLGANATIGIKNVAETGATTNFNTEVNTAITANNAKEWLNGGGLASATGSISINNVELTEDFHYITLVTMIAPSPDWFVAVNSLDLRNDENTGWKTSFTVDVFAYDAGTDNGTDYESSNSPNTPVGISKITGAPIHGKKMGTFTATLKSVLNVEHLNPLENTSIYPNPSKGEITLSNLENITLKSAEIYNVLGRLVKNIPVEKGASKLDIDLSYLNKGVYLLSLKSANSSTTKKLVIN